MSVDDDDAAMWRFVQTRTTADKKLAKFGIDQDLDPSPFTARRRAGGRGLILASMLILLAIVVIYRVAK